MSVNTVQNDGSLLRVAGGTLWADSPIGTILPYGGTSAPSGWMICDGASLLRASYPELFAVIGTAFGSADSTHFNIPDMRESVPKGAGLTGHTVGAHLDADGLAVGEFLDDRLQDHTHELSETPNYSYLTGSGNYKVVPVSGGSIQTGTVSNTYRKGDTTEVKSVGVNYIIKAKMVALPADLASRVEEYIDENATSPVSASNKLVTENGLDSYISSLSGVTQVGDWNLIRLGNSELYLGLYFHANIAYNTRPYNVPLPDGYSRVQYYFGQCFQEGNTQNVTGAVHTGGRDYAITIYINSISEDVYEVRACCLFQKNS